MSPVPLHASFSDSTRKRTASKFHKPNPLASVVKIAVPGIIAAAFIYKYITQKGKKPASAGQQGSESKKTATAPRKTTQKPRKDVKVKRDPEAAAEAREIAREQEATGLTHDDEMEVIKYIKFDLFIRTALNAYLQQLHHPAHMGLGFACLQACSPHTTTGVQ